LEHRLILPLVGATLIWTGSGAVAWLRRERRVGTALWTCAFVTAVILTNVHGRVFRDPLTFWESGVRSSPHSAFAVKGLGRIYHERGRLEEAEKTYRRALELSPDEFLVHNNLGLLYMQRGMYLEAERAFEREIELHPLLPDPYRNLVRLSYRQGRPERAAYWKSREP
jgi:tetratricopeptide (TPR) repeat protein